MQFSIESVSPIKKSPIVPPLSDSNIDFAVSAGENKKFEEGESPKNTCEPMSGMDSCLYLQYETCYNLAFEVWNAAILSSVDSEKIQCLPNTGSRCLSCELDQFSVAIRNHIL